MGSLIVCLFLGKLLIFTIQKFTSANIRWRFLKDLVECDFCLGVWIFTFLAFTLDINIYREWINIWLLSHAFTGITFSFAVHLWSVGWKAQYSTIYLE